MDEPRLLNNVPATSQPVVLRSRFVHQMVVSVNKNTLRLTPPRNVNPESPLRKGIATGIAQGNTNAVEGADGFPDNDTLFTEQEKWWELRRTTSTVRVTNPDDDEQFVDVLRIDRMLFVKSDGSIAELTFNNPATE